MVAQESDPVVDYKTLTAPVKSAVDKFDLLPAFLKVRGLVKEHIDSFNYFIDHGIHKIVEANKRLVCVHDPTLFLEYKRIYVGNPTVHIDCVEQHITPQMCRLSDRTYAAPIYVDVEFTKGNKPNEPTEQRHRMLIGQMPIMLRSSHCVLRGKDEAELAKLGECPLDPGGYFIAKGNEKVILIQEQLSKNRIIIDRDNKGRVSASVTSSTHETKSKTVFFMEKDKIYLQLNQFSKPVPIMIILKAMGIESDQEIVQMLGRDPRYGSLLLPSIQECYSEKIYTQKQALDYLDEKVGSTGAARARIRKEGEGRKIIRDIFLANVPVHDGNFRPKCIYAAVMLRRMMDAILNSDTMDDKDYVGNKRLELSGQLMSLLFEDLFKTMNTHAIEQVNSAYSKSNSAMQDFTAVLQRFSPITQGLERAISTGNWDLKRFKMHRKGVSQGLCRLSFIAALGHMTRISPQFEKTRKVSGPRALQPSQWGMLCPCDTPEGEACGLTKNLALMTHVTTDEEEGPIISMCQSLGVQDLASLSGEEIHSPTSFLVIFNGLILGKHKDPKRFANAMRKLRRKGKIGEFVSIFVNDQQRCVYVASDGGRVCRPLVIADEGVSRIKEHHMKELRDGFRCFNDFLRDGLIEYLDVNEENNAVISLYEHQAKDLNGEKNEVDRKSITHVEIEPFTILGVCAGLIPYPHHNQSPRNTYQCAMGKQAMGNIAYNQLFRADSLIYLLVYPQRPLLTTKSIELVGYDKLGAGQNATVAVMSYSGYDIEDAIVMNKSSLDRGFGRCITMKKYSVLKEKTDRIIRPQNEQNKQILDADGIAAPGQIIRNHDIYVNKQSPKNLNNSSAPKDQVYVDSNAKYKGVEGETTVVDRVLLCSDTDDKLSIKCIIRHTRRPEVGDKFSSRHGQKGVVGTIVQQEDFPFSERGICPDLIMNPHGYPSRMTIGKMIELLGGKAGVSCGRFHYGSAFGEPSGHADKVEDISYTLVKHGFSYSGKDFIYSGITGHPLQAYIFMGPIYYQKLKHMVLGIRRLLRHPLTVQFPSQNYSHCALPGTRRGEQRNKGEIAQSSGGHDAPPQRGENKGDGTKLRWSTELGWSTKLGGKHKAQVGSHGAEEHKGLRVGEMERDCLIAYGASMLIYERLMLSSDPYQVQVCRKCGLLGYYNYKLKTAFCSTCKTGENVATMMLPYACKLLFQELQSMNVVPRLRLAEV